MCFPEIDLVAAEFGAGAQAAYSIAVEIIN